ncbi:MADS-box transcription factor rlmA-like [Phragmites australis]|uniref:MADS-box transcription factor rlmA-like n=1 Tax=Phragmites australis TaxID=29695 RepID=UPI002D76F2E2|nr:MADS-box transcription factor rlmA-like [Phragmites australis]
MPRRVRRSGVRFIEDDRDRSLTFFKRRAGIFKTAADLSALTGARIAVVLESKNGRFSSFGAPEVSPIVDTFLSENAPMESHTKEEQKATIANLQNVLFQLEKDRVVEDKRKKDSIARTKEVQESSRMAKYVYGKEEDLDANELYELCRELSRIQEDIRHRLPSLHHGNLLEVGAPRDPELRQPSQQNSLASLSTPPRRSPWTPFQPSLQLGQPTWSHPMLARSDSLFPNPAIPPSPQLPPKPLLRHPMTPLAPSMVRLQAQKMPLPMEAHPPNYYIWGMGINGNNSRLFSQSPILPSPPPQPPSLQFPPTNVSSPPLPSSLPFSLPLESQQTQNYNFVQPPQSYADANSTLVPSNEPYYGGLQRGLDVGLGNIGDNGGQATGDHNMFGYSGPLQGDAWVKVMSQSFAAGESSNVDAGNNLGGMNFPWI